MCPHGQSADVQTVKVATVLAQSDQLATCTTVAELRAGKPDIGSVLLGGNCLGPCHSLILPHNVSGATPPCLDAVVGKYVALCVFVGSASESSGSCRTKWTDRILLPHTATINDLKSAFVERNTILTVALQGASRASLASMVIVRDVDLRFLADAEVLPESQNANACSDVGYHAMFFFDMVAPSMQQTFIKKQIVVSPAAIEDFANTPCNLGVLPRDALSELTNCPDAYVHIRDELDARLTAGTQQVPERLSTAPLDSTHAVMYGLKEDNASNLPLTIALYAKEIVEEIQSTTFDSLDPNFARTVASHLEKLRPFVKLLTRSEWTNYQTLTSHPEDWSVAEIVTKLQDRQSALKLREAVLLCDPSGPSAKMDQKAKKENEIECEEFADDFAALHAIFEQAHNKHQDLTAQLWLCQQTCSSSLLVAKEDDARFKTLLLDERCDLVKLGCLNKESDCLHDLILEQIKWCKDFVADSSTHAQNRINTRKKEILRLQEQNEQDHARLQQLDLCNQHLDDVEATEQELGRVNSEKMKASLASAQERVSRAEKGVTSSSRFVLRLGALHEEVKVEMHDALEYGLEFLKSLGADCHSAFLGTGKFLAMQGSQAERNRERCADKTDMKIRASLQADSLEDYKCPSTVKDADEARAERVEAENNLQAVLERISDNSDVRAKLVADYASVHAFICSQIKKKGSSKVEMDTLPMHSMLADVSSVAEFRESRDLERVVRTLESLDLFEIDWVRRYSGEREGNFERLWQKSKSFAGRMLQ